MTGWRSEKMTLAPEYDIYNGTWGFCNPQKELYDAFVAEEGENGLRLTQSIISYNRLIEKGFEIKPTDVLYGCEGSLMWKTRKVNGEFITGGFMASHNNSRVMRYPEVLLLAAEAHVKGGGSKAADYLNEVRTRAGLSPKNSVTMEDVMLEKRLELCGESVRYQDMLRWRIADKMINQGTRTPSLPSNGVVTYQSFNSAGAAGFKSNMHWLLPFPQTEITLNPNIKQNTGW
ncbi:MAG: RagB/SusD family nutrient uptake outer membrane protein, partial [Bacteroidales bacterium]|jgi:hypothetical protein|nr:RagB/SusD family nutrient uptake outer membrane protein [Bacteroidales bacterium]